MGTGSRLHWEEAARRRDCGCPSHAEGQPAALAVVAGRWQGGPSSPVPMTSNPSSVATFTRKVVLDTTFLNLQMTEEKRDCMSHTSSAADMGLGGCEWCGKEQTWRRA